MGPEHARLHETGRVTYTHVTDEEALAAFHFLSETEGLIPALESAHAVAYARRVVPGMTPEQVVIVNLSGRGDKDVLAVARREGVSV